MPMKLEILNYLLLIYLLSAEIISHPNYLQDFPQSQITNNVISQVSKDYESGVIGIDEWARNIAYSLFETSKMKNEYKSLSSAILSTSLLKEIAIKWEDLNEDTKNIFQNYGFNERGNFKSPAFLHAITESEHFQFHYSVAAGDTNAVNPIDNNVNGIPDYIDNMMTIFEFVYQTEIGIIGFNEPPSDSGRVGTNAKFDIYVFKLQTGTYGYCAGDSIVGDNPNSPEIEKHAASSYMAMRNDYSMFNNLPELDNIRVTAAHEFNHAITNGYDYYEKTWLSEATATWIEDEVYDYINQNYIYLPNWFAFPHYPLDATEAEFKNRWYGSFIFLKYISEHLDGWSTIRKIWEKSIDYDSQKADRSFDAINDVLVEEGSNFKDEFINFSISNLYKTFPPYDYEEGSDYPNIRANRTIFTTTKNIRERSLRHGTYYYKLQPVAFSSSFNEIEIDLTIDKPEVNVNLVIATKSGNTIEKFVPAKQGNKISFSINESAKNDSIFILVVNTDTTETEFTLDINYKGELVKLSDSGEFNYGQFKDGYYLYRTRKEVSDNEGNFKTEFTLQRLDISVGISLTKNTIIVCQFTWQGILEIFS